MAIRRGTATALALALGIAAMATGAEAQSERAPRPLRLIGTTVGGGEDVPRRFVIDAVLTPGDEAFQSTVKGWLAPLPASPAPSDDASPTASSAEVEGVCVERRCAVTASLDGGKLSLTGDLEPATGAGAGRFKFEPEYDDKPHAEGAASFTPFKDTVPGLGALAAPGAVTGEELANLLAWNGSDSGSSAEGDDPPGDTERSGLAAWQGSNGGPATGLIFAADLETLRAGAASAQAAGGWTRIGDAAKGWSAGYPAKILTRATTAGGERRYESGDGKARLTVAELAPVDGDGFDALWEEAKTASEGKEDVNYSRVNRDFDIRWTDKGMVTAMVAHARDGALVRQTFTYPADQADAYLLWKDVLARSLRVADVAKE